jgi:hypothetical protein
MTNSGQWKHWIPAFAGMTNSGQWKHWVPAFAGMTTCPGMTTPLHVMPAQAGIQLPAFVGMTIPLPVMPARVGIAPAKAGAGIQCVRPWRQGCAHTAPRTQSA